MRNPENVLVVYKKSTFEQYTNSPDKETRTFAFKNLEMHKSHEHQVKALELVINELNSFGINHKEIYRGDLTKMGNPDLIVVVGGDGTLLDLAHYVKEIHVPILGVNSDPGKSVGYFSLCHAQDFKENFRNIKEMPQTELSRLKMSINGQPIPEYALNDVLITHVNPAAMMRYKLSVDDRGVVDRNDNNNLRSSGLLVATPGGSTAFMYNEGGEAMSLTSSLMQYHERSIRNSPFGFAESKIELESLTRESKMWIDGEHLTYDVTLGDKISITPGKPVTIIGCLELKRQKYLTEVLPRKFEGE